MTLPEGSTVLLKTAKTYAMDLAERVVWTFVMAFAGVAVAAGPAGLLDASMWSSAAAAGVAAVGALLKGLAARYMGVKNSASTARGV